jgi:hypothetical protein
MSRSYRKYLARRMNDQFYKRLVHRKNRALERQGIFLSSRQYRHVVNRYDICDYIPNAMRTGGYWYHRHTLDEEWFKKYIRWLRRK